MEKKSKQNPRTVTCKLSITGALIIMEHANCRDRKIELTGSTKIYTKELGVEKKYFTF